MPGDVHFHPAASIAYKPIDELIGVLGIRMSKNDDPDRGPTEVPVFGLAFLLPTGDAHIFAFSEDGKRELVKTLTGGIFLAEGAGF